MATSDPKTLYLPFWLAQEFNVAKLLAGDDERSWSQGYRLLEYFDVRSHERTFVKELLGGRTNVWLFRSNQRQSCGDFVAVDMSPPDPAERTAYVIELKSGEPLALGGAHRQSANYRAALDEIAERHGIITAASAVEMVRGDGDVVLEYLARRG